MNVFEKSGVATVLWSALILSAAASCSFFTTTESDDTLIYAAAAYAAATQNASTTTAISSYCASSSVVNNGLGLGVESATLNGGTATCWTCTTNNSASLPAWIKDNFKCMTITVAASTYDFATNDTPPHKSGYYKAGAYGANCTESFPSGNSANPLQVSSQTITMKVPQTPDESSSTVSLGVAGLAVNGAVIFNDSAAPGDSLASELSTMDQGYGHPNASNQYHYHTEPCKISRNDSSLIGIALDGYAIYGRYDTNGTLPTLDSNNFHSGSTGIDGNSKGHYHIESSSMNLILRSNYHGSKGSVL